MNLDNDYDDDGNNIVPCPICLSKYCPSKEDGKEDMFALEAEIRLLLDEYKATYDNSRIANVLEAVEKLLTSRDTYWKERVRSVVEEIPNATIDECQNEKVISAYDLLQALDNLK